MNFRELFSKLDEIAIDADAPVQNKMGQMTKEPVNQTPDTNANSQMQTKIPGQQPGLGVPKQDLTPQELKALQFPNQKPDAKPAVVTDPKADVNAMAKALQAMAAQSKPQMQMQPTTSSGIEQQKAPAQQPRSIDGPKPGEPMEEYQFDEADENRSLFRQRGKKKATPPEVIDNTPEAIKYYAELYNKDKSTNIPPELKDRVIARAAELKPAVPTAGAQENPPSNTNANTDTGNNKDGKDNKDGKPAANTDTGNNKDGKDNKDGKPAANTDTGSKKNDPKKWASGVTSAYGMGNKDKPNEQVRKMQQDLKDAGYGDLLGDEGADGVFRAKTKAALAKFQADNKLKDQSGRAAGNETNPILSKIAADKRAAAAAAAVPTEVKPTDSSSSSSSSSSTEVRPANPASASDGPVAVATREQPPSISLLDPALKKKDGIQRDDPNDPAFIAKIRTAMDNIASQRALDAEREKEAKLKARYDGVADKDFRVQTGNMQKSHFDLKQGDRDVDPKTGNVMRWRAAPAGQHPVHGSWEIDDSVPGQGFRERPGLGLIGPKDTSPEGQAIFDRQRRQVISQDELERLQKLRAAQQPATPSASTKTVAAEPKAATTPQFRSQGELDAHIASLQKDGKTIDDNLRKMRDTLPATVAEPSAEVAPDAGARAIAKAASGTQEQINLREMSEQLHSLADELINETK